MSSLVYDDQDVIQQEDDLASATRTHPFDFGYIGERGVAGFADSSARFGEGVVGPALDRFARFGSEASSVLSNLPRVAQYGSIGAGPQGAMALRNVERADDTSPQEFWQGVQRRAEEGMADYSAWRHQLETPDPDRANWASELLFGLTSMLGVATIGTTTAGPVGGASALAAGYGVPTYRDLRAEGVDEETARNSALIEGGFMAAFGLVTPGASTADNFFVRLGERAARGAGLNLVLGGGYRAALGGYLEHQGYTEQAKRYNWLDGRAAISDAAIGAFFGALHGGHDERRSTAINDALGAEDAPVTQTPTMSASDHLREASLLANSGDLVEGYAHALLAEHMGEQEGANLARQIAEDGGEEVYRDGAARAIILGLEDGVFQPTRAQADAAMHVQDEAHVATSGQGIALNVAADAEIANDLRTARKQAANGEEMQVPPRDPEAEYAPNPDLLNDVNYLEQQFDYHANAIEEARAAGDTAAIAKHEAAARALLERRDQIARGEVGPQVEAVAAIREVMTEIGAGDLTDDLRAQLRDQGMSDERIAQLLGEARAMHGDRPDEMLASFRANKKPAHGEVHLETLVGLRDLLLQRGEKYGALKTIADITGLERNNVTQRLRLHDLVPDEKHDLVNRRSRDMHERLTRLLNDYLAHNQNALRTGRQPGRYSQASLERLMDEAEKLVAEHDGKMPRGWDTTLAERSGQGDSAYQATTVSQYIFSMGKGTYGEELAARAQALPNVSMAGSGLNATVVARLLDQGITKPQVILERLNAARAEVGKKPTTIASVYTKISQIRKARRDGESLYSLTDHGSASVRELNAYAEDAYGAEGWAALRNALHLEVFANRQDLAGSLESAGERSLAENLRRLPEDPSGLYMPSTKKTYIFADHVSPATLKPTLLHEGWHFHIREFLGPRLYNETVRGLLRMHGQQHPLVVEAFAFASIKEGEGSARFNEELGAYTAELAALDGERSPFGSNDNTAVLEGRIEAARAAGQDGKILTGHAEAADRALAWLMENAPDFPLVNRILARLRQWVWTKFGQRFGDALTIEDVRQLAVASLRRVQEQGRREAAEMTPIEAPSVGAASGEQMTRPPWPAGIFNSSRDGIPGTGRPQLMTYKGHRLEDWRVERSDLSDGVFVRGPDGRGGFVPAPEGASAHDLSDTYFARAAIERQFPGATYTPAEMDAIRNGAAYEADQRIAQVRDFHDASTSNAADRFRADQEAGIPANAPEAGQAAAGQSGRLSENQIEEAIDRRHGRGVSRGAERTVPTANFMPTLDQLIPDPYAAELESDAILRTFNAHAREELRTGRLAQEVEIPIADLVAVQSRVRTNYADSLEHARGDLPEVLYRNGRYYLVEGHNRVAAMAARGDTQVRVRAFGRNEGRTRAAPDAGAAMGEQTRTYHSTTRPLSVDELRASPDGPAGEALYTYPDRSLAGSWRTVDGANVVPLEVHGRILDLGDWERATASLRSDEDWARFHQTIRQYAGVRFTNPAGEVELAIFPNKNGAFPNLRSAIHAPDGGPSKDEPLASMGHQPPPAFYSAVERHVLKATTARASGSQWWSTLSRAPGVKQEELQWIGLQDWLKAQDGPVSREDVLAFVRDNGVRVEETVLGGESVDPKVQQQLLPLIEERDRLRNAMLDGDNSAAIAAATQDPQVQAAYQAFREADKAGADALARELDAGIPRVVSEDQWAWVIESSAGQRRVSKTDYERRGLEGALEDVAATDRNNYKAVHRLADQRRLEVRAAARDLSVRLNEQISELQGEVRRSDVRWSQYQLPGGQNYKELILSVPGIEPFEPTDTVHFGNTSGGRVIAWTRYNERVDVNGLRTLNVEEFQSRRHQFGRDYGYKGGAEFRRIESKLLDAGLDQETINALVAQDRGVTEQTYDKIRQVLTDAEMAELRAETSTQRVPDAPFKDNAWARLAMKRMIRWAAEHGFEQITWTRGQHQIDRYNLSEAVGEIRAYTDNDGSSFTVTLGNHRASEVLVENGLATESQRGNSLSGGGFIVMKPDQMREAFGNEIARQIIERGAPTDRSGGPEVVLSGDDLRVGGEGMRAFYDRIMPNIANDLGKKFGARVGETEVSTGHRLAVAGSDTTRWRVRDTNKSEYVPGVDFETKAEAEAWAREHDPHQESETVHALPITPQMRDEAMGGQPLFSFAPGNRGQNGGNSVEGNHGKADPIESEDYQERLRQVRESVARQAEAGDAARSEPGSVQGVAGEPAGRGRGQSGAGEGGLESGAPDRSLLRAIVDVSGLEFTKKPEIDRGDYRLRIDTPFASDADAVLRSEVKLEKEGGPTWIDFDMIDGSNPKETGLPGVYLMHTRVADGARGAGIGTWLYRHLIEWADRRGLPVYSDAWSVSRDAQKIYARLEDMGYQVERLGHPKRAGDGSLLSTDGQPVFRVSKRGEIETPLTGAPLPREDYQVDGPTLRQRMEQAQAREQALAPMATFAGKLRALSEVYNKLTPEQQALADNPDMRIVTERGEQTARQAIEEAEAAQKRAKELREGYEAAAKCAIRHGGSMAAQSFVSMAARGGVGAGLGQVFGAAAGIPAGIIASNMLASNSERVAPNSPYARLRRQQAHLSANEQGRRAGLDEPAQTFQPSIGTPLAQARAPADAVDTSAPEEAQPVQAQLEGGAAGRIQTGDVPAETTGHAPKPGQAVPAPGPSDRPAPRNENNPELTGMLRRVIEGESGPTVPVVTQRSRRPRNGGT